NNNFISVASIATSNTSYLDDEVTDIYIHDDYNMQVILRKDAEFYRTVFEAIPIEYYLKCLWKSSVHAPKKEIIQDTFNALFAVAHAVQRGVAVLEIQTTSQQAIDPAAAYAYAMKGII
ncbi:MAG: hypothetical protein ACRCZG_01065, partial [Culicoidibacterales bacterium]